MDLRKVSRVRSGRDLWIFVLLMAMSSSRSSVKADPDFDTNEGPKEELDTNNEPQDEDPHEGAKNYYIWTGVMLGILFMTVFICFIASMIYNKINKRRQRTTGNSAAQEINIPKVFVMHPPLYISQEPPPYSAPDYLTEDPMKQIQQDKQHFKRAKATYRDMRFQHLQLTNPAFNGLVCNSVHQVTTDCVQTLGTGNGNNHCLCYTHTSGTNPNTEESPPPYHAPQFSRTIMFNSDYNETATSSTTNDYIGVNSRPMPNRDSQSNTEHSGEQNVIVSGEEHPHDITDIGEAAVKTSEQDTHIVITNLNRPINHYTDSDFDGNNNVGMEQTTQL